MSVNWLERQERLIGKDNCEILKRATIMVCGLGGVGGACCEALCRAGVGRLILIDNDTVCETNLNRQAFAFCDTIGMRKVEAARKKLLLINRELETVLLDIFLSCENIEKILLEYKPDYVVDAIDNVTAKLELARVCTQNNIPIIASMGTGNKLNPERLQISDISKTNVCPLARVMRRKLKDLGIKKLTVLWSDEVPIIPSGSERTPASVSFVPPAAGIMIAGHVVRDLISI